jgi:hypothetical protein
MKSNTTLILTVICFVWGVSNDSQLVEHSSSKVICHQRESILSSFQLAVEGFIQVSNLFLQIMFQQRDQFYITILMIPVFADDGIHIHTHYFGTYHGKPLQSHFPTFIY